MCKTKLTFMRLLLLTPRPPIPVDSTTAVCLSGKTSVILCKVQTERERERTKTEWRGRASLPPLGADGPLPGLQPPAGPPPCSSAQSVRSNTTCQLDVVLVKFYCISIIPLLYSSSPCTHTHTLTLCVTEHTNRDEAVWLYIESGDNYSGLLSSLLIVSL